MEKPKTYTSATGSKSTSVMTGHVDSMYLWDDVVEIALYLCDLPSPNP